MSSPEAAGPLTPDRRRQLTRDHLLRAAAHVFAAQGFHGASLDEVAAAAGFSKGAVYSNFRNKEDLFLALLGWRYEMEMEALRATLRSGPAASEHELSQFAELIRRELNAEGADWLMLYEEFHLYALRNAPAREKLAELERQEMEEVGRLIAEERRRHGLAPLDSPTTTARIIVGLMRGVSMMRALDPEEAGDGLLDGALAFIADGLTAPPG